MSVFSGRQGPGAARRHRGAQRLAAEDRAAAYRQLGREAARARMCTKKNRYESYEFALGVAGNASRREALMRVYQCPVCDGFHLTHKPRRIAS